MIVCWNSVFVFMVESSSGLWGAHGRFWGSIMLYSAGYLIGEAIPGSVFRFDPLDLVDWGGSCLEVILDNLSSL